MLPDLCASSNSVRAGLLVNAPPPNISAFGAPWHSLAVQRFQLAGSKTTEIVLGAGASDLAERELSWLGADRALVLSTGGRRALAEDIAVQIGRRAVAVLSIAREHVPVEIAELGRKEASLHRADALVPVGGGSTVGLAKAIALEQALPILAIPTTYSGSEMTPFWGITGGGVKRTGRDDRVCAATVLYDPILSQNLPPAIAVPSAFNALAHAVEALYAPGVGEEVLGWAEEAVREIASVMPALSSGSNDLVARERALHGACLAGACVGRAAMGLHHKLCHVLGGSFGLPHAETHAALLPFVARFNLEAAPAARERLSRALGNDDPAAALVDLAQSSGVKLGLAKLGLPRDALERVLELATSGPYPNPREITKRELLTLLEEAFAPGDPSAIRNK